MADYRVISSDNHIYEPPDLWTKRIESKYRDRCPQIQPVEGGEAWFIEGVRGQGLTQGTQPGVLIDNVDEPEKHRRIRERPPWRLHRR